MALLLSLITLNNLYDIKSTSSAAGLGDDTITIIIINIHNTLSCKAIK